MSQRPLSGRILLLIATGLSVVNFSIGWISQREMTSRQVGVDSEKLRELQNWQQSQDGGLIVRADAERLRTAEIAIAVAEQRLAGLETVVRDIKLDLAIIRQDIRQARTP